MCANGRSISITGAPSTAKMIIMKWTREHASTDPEQLWRKLLDEGGTPDTLILVNNLLMERQVRKKWQRDGRGFAPDIRTVASFVEELAMYSMSDEELPALVLSPEERTLWLEQWLTSHEDPDYRRFAGTSSVTAISNIIADLYRERQSPGMLLDAEERAGIRSHGGHVLAGILREYELRMANKKWVDREHLPAKMTLCNTKLLRHSKIVLYLVDEPEPVHEHALGLVDGPEMICIRFAGDPKALLSTDGICLSAFHHPREELEQAVRQILALLAQAGRKNPDETRSGREEPDDALFGREEPDDTLSGREETDDAQSGQIGAQSRDGKAQIRSYDDVVILTGDLSLYEPMAAAVSERFGVPLYTSRGPSLIGNPFIRRLLTYLKLDLNGFPVDDVSRVFADNRLVLPDLPDHDENKAPNIRHFSQFCREYNFRDLKEAATGMPRVFDKLLSQIRFEDDEEKEERRRERERRNREFYLSVLEHLDALRRFYKAPERQTLAEWVAWTRKLLLLQGNLKSREANEAKELLEIILKKLTDAETRLELGRQMDCRDFFRVLELRLKETRERPMERPGGVLLTEIRHLPEVHDKVVFILGLHEDGFPRAEKPDFLQFRYEKALRSLTKKDGSEGYLLARMQLQRLLSSDMPRYLSRPNLVAQKPVMPSPLWLELLHDRKEEDFRPWPVTGENWLMSRNETGRLVALLTQKGDPAHVTGKQGVPAGGGSGRSDVEYGALFPGVDERAAWVRIHQKNGNVPGAGTDRRQDWFAWQLAAAVQKARQDPERMGRYDGVLDPDVTAQWLGQQTGDGALQLSISRLDTFATSPHEYFFRYVLRLEPLHEYQDDAESNIKGSLLHHILEEFYSETEHEGAPVWPPDDPEAARRRMERIRRRLVDSYRHQLGNPESPFPGILEKNLERVTRWFLERECAGREEFLAELDDARPAVFHPGAGFKMEHKWSFDEEFGGVPVRFRGMIDRIDVMPDGGGALILDYKSGRSGIKKYNDICQGKGYQLPVYAMFVRSEGLERFVAGYYILPISGKKKDVKCEYALGSSELVDDGYLLNKDSSRNAFRLQYKPAGELKEFMAAIGRLRISWIVEAIRSGRFHASLDADPAWSDFRHIKRHEVRVQLRRKSREIGRRRRKAMTYELDRYYLSEPFWEDDHGK
jgi:hypothetical protein